MANERARFPISRRNFLRLGTLGSLTWPDLLRLRAASPLSTPPRVRSVIMIVLPGGPSHLDTYDMKPDAPEEIRGEFRPTRTNVPGLHLCELMPRQARSADRLAVVRNLRFRQPDHQLHEVYTGYPLDDHRPAFGSIVSRLRQENQPAGGSSPLPRYVSLSLSDHPRTVARAEVPSWAGPAHRPFEPDASFFANLDLPAEQRRGLRERRTLLRTFDGLRRDLDAGGRLAAQEAFTGQALDLLTSERVRDAFDLGREPQAVRDLYGPDVRLAYNYQFGHTWHGSDFLLARRLAEAGVPVVTIGEGGWDHHGNLNGVRGTIFERSREQLPLYDRSIHALVTDLHQRGLDREIAVLVWGEFGRTPRVNRYGGRDHWTPAGFALFACGGLATGQAIGATDAQGARPRGASYTPQNVFATLYHLLGISPETTLTDFTGRPRPLLDDTRPIAELL